MEIIAMSASIVRTPVAFIRRLLSRAPSMKTQSCPLASPPPLTRSSSISYLLCVGTSYGLIWDWQLYPTKIDDPIPADTNNKTHMKVIAETFTDGSKTWRTLNGYAIIQA